MGDGVLDALDEAGYDTTELHALAETARTAHENGDTDAARAAMEQFREAVQTAAEEAGLECPAMNGNGAGPRTGVLDALDEAGYDTTELRALAETARSAHENGDTDAARAAMEQFREAVQTAAEEAGLECPAMNGDGAGPRTGVLDALDEAGYDTTELRALAETARSAHENGDTDAARAAMEQFREAVQTAAEEAGLECPAMNGDGEGPHQRMFRTAAEESGLERPAMNGDGAGQHQGMGRNA
ncbi:hypothetical protein CUJ86_05270 [Methanofollis fontis]|uniref:Uncharacterized protein n=2 Tax=Methanofollis fontis TaxID=2052832 RepID=A0A483CR99_9EURY|nr:hypothetical protein CUJ86_05270 [Methanofollis fontis]